MTAHHPPYDVVWPENLLTPRDVHELVTATYLVHEAAHAVAAMALGADVVEVWARQPDHADYPSGMRMGDGFSSDPDHDRKAAVIAYAARPAVLRYLAGGRRRGDAR